MFVEHRIHISQAHALLGRNEIEDGGIEVARSGTHDQPLEWRKTHRCINRLAAHDGARRRAVAEMQRDDFGGVARPSGELTVAIRDIAMRRAMKAIASHAVPPVKLVRYGIDVRGLRQAVMERGVEHSDLWNAGSERRARRRDTAQVVRVVQRREFDQFLEAAPHVVIYARRVGEALAAVHDAVPHGFDLADLRDRDAGFVARQPGDDVLDSSRVVADGRGAFHRPAAGCFQRHDGFATDAIELAAGQAPVARLGDGRAVRVDELELERRRADVQDENDHVIVELLSRKVACALRNAIARVRRWIATSRRCHRTAPAARQPADGRHLRAATRVDLEEPVASLAPDSNARPCAHGHRR